MKKVICISSQKAWDNPNIEIVKNMIYTVISEETDKGVKYYMLEELPDGYGARIENFRDYEEPPVLVTFTKIVETYPVHAN